MAIALLPILIILLIIFTLSILSAQSKNSRWGSFFQGRKLKVVLFSYFILLVLSAAVFPFVSFSSVSDAQVMDVETEIREIHEDFYNSLVNNKKPNLEKMDLRETFEVEYAEDSLYILSPDWDFYGTVIVEEIEQLNGKIKIMNYVSPAAIDNIVLTEELPSLEVELDGNKLLVTSPIHHEINLALFKKEFTITQFFDDSSFHSRGYSMLGDPFVYIQVPENMKIIPGTEENIYIHYVK